MRVLSIALVTLASAISLWAQGRVVEGSEVLVEATRTDINAFELPPLSISTSSNWLPPRALSDSSGVEMIEAFRAETLIDLPVQPILPPTPDFQISQAGIQPAPEPSTFALGSLAIGLITLTRLNKRQQILRR